MKFDKSKVFTALNADELKVGSKVIVADTLYDLQKEVENENELILKILVRINDVKYACRFVVDNSSGYSSDYNLAYLVEEPQENYLKWTDLKIGDKVCLNETVVYTIMAINYSEITDLHVYIAGYGWVNDEVLKGFELVLER